MKIHTRSSGNFLAHFCPPGTQWSRDLNPRFSVIFQPMIWIFLESKEPEIISTQASKRDRTLLPSSIFSGLGWRLICLLYQKLTIICQKIFVPVVFGYQRLHVTLSVKQSLFSIIQPTRIASLKQCAGKFEC